MLSYIRVRTRLRATCALLATLLWFMTLPAEAADIDAATRALQEGDFETAYREAHPLAEQGDDYARKIAGVAKLMMELKQQIDRREKERFAATGPIDLRDYDGRYKPERSATDQAQFEKGRSLYEADDFDAAFRTWLPLAESGDPEAQYEIGQLYLLGKGIEKGEELGNIYVLKSAEQGYGTAQGDLAALTNPFGVSKDKALQREAFYWGIRAAANGDPWGYHTLSSAYCDGEGVDRNPVLADIWLYLIFSERDHFLSLACNSDIDLPVPYYEAIAARAEAMRRAYDIPLVPQN
jgi:TPR repeat protein